VRRLWRWWLKRQAKDVARRLVEAEAIYSTRVALHGRSSYIYYDELSKMKGAVEVLIFDLELLNDRLKGKKC